MKQRAKSFKKRITKCNNYPDEGQTWLWLEGLCLVFALIGNREIFQYFENIRDL